MLFHLVRNIKKISPDEAYMSAKMHPSIVFLDVREADEFKNGHIKGARNLPVNQIREKMEDMHLSRDTKLYVYCHSGVRSTEACSILENMGYNYAYDLGGIINWPYEIVQ